jgi:hypothetical protein
MLFAKCSFEEHMMLSQIQSKATWLSDLYAFVHSVVLHLLRVSSVSLLVLVLQGESCAAQNATQLALTTSSDKAKPVLACLARKISPLVAAEHLSTGLEARVALHPAVEGAQFSLTLLLKPDVYSLLSSVDEDPEAHPVLQVALLNNLRHHIETRIYPWRNSQDCREAADWLTDMTRIAIDMSPKE